MRNSGNDDIGPTVQQRKPRKSSKPKATVDGGQSALVFTGERIVPQADNCEPNFASRMYQEHIARYLFASQIVKGKSVIDIGCGVGYGSQRLAQLGAASVHAFDLSEDAIRHARLHYAHPNIRYEMGNAERFTTDRTFDVAVCFELIEHVRKPRSVMQNIRKALRDDGILVMSTPRALAEKRTHFHEHEFGLEEYLDLIRGYFADVDIYVENNHFSSLVTKTCPSDLRRILCLKDQFAAAKADVFIAIASASGPLPPMEPALALDDDAYVTMLERDVAILHKAEDDLRERVKADETEFGSQIKFKDAEIERLTGEYEALFKRSEDLATKLWEAERRGIDLASKDSEIERLTNEYQRLFARCDELSTKLWETEQRNSELASKEAEIEQLTLERDALRTRLSDLSNRLQESEMRHAELQQEQKKLREEVELLAVRSADADARRMEAYEFARVASQQADGLRRELEILKRDIAVALDRPSVIERAQDVQYDERHRDIVHSMERLFLGTEATHHIARDPIIERVARLSRDLTEQRDRAEYLSREIEALQEFQRHAEDWHRQLLRIRRSVSWRITAPIRAISRPFRRSRPA